MFKLISYGSTKYLVKSARVPRHLVNELREDLLIGSGCYNGEIFNTALTKCDEELIEAIENATASLEREGFSVTDQDKQWCEKLLNKEITFDDYLAYALKKSGITE